MLESLVLAFNFIKKEIPSQAFSYESCEILKSTFFTEHLHSCTPRQTVKSKGSFQNSTHTFLINSWRNSTVCQWKTLFSTRKIFCPVFSTFLEDFNLRLMYFLDPICKIEGVVVSEYRSCKNVDCHIFSLAFKN